jgi:hypothetical protein
MVAAFGVPQREPRIERAMWVWGLRLPFIKTPFARVAGTRHLDCVSTDD